jgi:hypothetical protein
MPPMSPESAALQQMIAEASARLRVQIRQEIAALCQAVDESQQLVQTQQRERLEVILPESLSTPQLQDGNRASEIGASRADLVRFPLPIAR